MSASPLRVVQYGLGSIGQATARAVLENSDAMTLVGAFEIDPNKVGRDVADVIGADASYDAVKVGGDPLIDLRIHGGTFGDTATVGVLVNTVLPALDAQPGLRSMMGLPVPRAFATAPEKRAELED